MDQPTDGAATEASKGTEGVKNDGVLTDLRFKLANGVRAFRSWVVPYVNSRIHAGAFRPLLCYLYTDWKCNLDCHYCFQFDNRRPGMTLETAQRSIDWLRSIGCRVIALMGGEPLVRKEFILEVVRYGRDQGCFMYLPTNGRLLDERLIDRLGEAGVTAVNLAVDCLDPRRGLPKALSRIERQFRYLVERQKTHNYLVFFNINICRTNIADVRRLTEIAHEHQIGTDYHLNEPPHGFVDVDHYRHREDGLFLTPDQHGEVDDLLDWLVDRQIEGWPMVNSVEHLKAFKQRMRGRIDPWDCRAGLNGALIRPDGTLSPCFDMITYGQDWGRVGDHRFEASRLRELKERCLPNCSSTCFRTMAYYYDLTRLPQWVRKHAAVG